MKNLLINRALAAKKKKIFTLLLAIAASVGTMFASDTKVDGIWYDFNDSASTAIVTYKGSYGDAYLNEYAGTVVIPASVTYRGKTYSVTSIRDYAFHWCDGLTSVTIPNSVTSIGVEAFAGCSGLTSVTIPNSVTSIGNGAFSGRGLTSPVYNAHVFAKMPTSYSGAYTIPDGIESIAGSAFYGCTGLTSVTIPNSVTSIGEYAFWGCSGLTSVTIGNSVTSIGGYAFYECTGLTSVTIPNSVTSFGEWAFCGCDGLTSVTIPNSVTSIGDHAFSRCTRLTSVTIPNSVTSIGGWAFDGCTGLTSPVYNAHVFAYMPTSYSGAYTIPDGIESIAGGAFQECTGLTSVTIPNSVTSIGIWAFAECTGLTSVTIPNSVSSIGERAFWYCKGLTSVTIGNSVTSIGASAFQSCSALTSVTIPNSVTSIGGAAFYACTALTSVTIPNSVTSIGEQAFSGCSSLTSVTIPNSVTSIGDRTFSSCSGLTSVTIPNSVTSIGKSAFGGCSGLTSVTIEAETPPTLRGNSDEAKQVFGNTNNCPIYVPCSAVNAYKTAWWPYADRIYENPDCHITVRLDPSSCSGWSTVRLWAWTDSGDLFNSWPGQVVGKDIDGWYSYTFDEDITSVNIIWNNGTDKTVNIDGVTSSTCYALNSTSGKAITVSIVDCVTGLPLGHADETTTTDVTATPNEDNSVTLTWPAVNGVDTYTIEIKKNGVLVCTLVFNANGQMISMSFAAPARDGKGRNIPAAEQSANGWTYVVTGLEGNASYTYSVTAKDVNGNVLLKQSVDFSTSEEQGIEDVLSDPTQCTKVIRNGQVFILRGDKTYTLTGQETIMQ